MPQLSLILSFTLAWRKKKLAYLYPHPLLALIAKKHWCVKRGGRRSQDCQWKGKIQKCGHFGGSQGSRVYSFPQAFLVRRRKGPVRGGRLDGQIKKKNLGMALGRVASLGLAFSALRLPTSPSLHLSKASSGSLVEASHSAFVPPSAFSSPPPRTHPRLGEGDARQGRMACWKSLKYMRMSANTHF